MMFQQFDPLSVILWFVLFTLLFFILWRLQFYKVLADLESLSRKLDNYTKRTIDLLCKICIEKGSGSYRDRTKIEDFIDFFVIPPVSLDPYGILKKLEFLIDKSEERIENFIQSIAPKIDNIWKANAIGLLKGAISLHTINKQIKHYIGLLRKTGSLQLAMVLQMFIPILRRFVDSLMKGIEAIANCKPIGDGIGPYVVAKMIKNKNNIKQIAKDCIYAEEVIDGKRVFLMKALGPGATVGKPGDGVRNIAKLYKISKVITIDAAAKLEGEETGKVSEGIGAAIGDPGPEKAKIEEVCMELNIPLEAIIIKMSPEEAIEPMSEKIAKSSDKVIEKVLESIKRSDGNVLVIGIGNTCGIGNCYDEVKDLKFETEIRKK